MLIFSSVQFNTEHSIGVMLEVVTIDERFDAHVHEAKPTGHNVHSTEQPTGLNVRPQSGSRSVTAPPGNTRRSNMKSNLNNDHGAATIKE